MNVICFVPSSDQLHKLSKAVFSCLKVDDKIEIYRSLETFMKILRLHIQWDSVFILCPQTMKHLHGLIAVKKYFNGSRIILVFPKNADSMVDSIYLLSPSFTIYENLDFKSICEVVEKIRSFQEKSPGNFYQSS